MKKTKFFNILEGEKIVEEIKPLPSLKWYFFFQGAFVFIFILLFFGWIPFVAGVAFQTIVPAIIIILFLIIMWLVAKNRYKHQHYWITNKRVICKRGIIGYTISSIPFERVSDVIISRTFFERLFGFGSVHVQSLAGQITHHGRLGAEGSMLAVPDPEGSQQKIFELMKKKRKVEHLTM